MICGLSDIDIYMLYYLDIKFSYCIKDYNALITLQWFHNHGRVS